MGRGTRRSGSMCWWRFNAMGLFHEFVDDKDVRLIGVEAAGFGLDSGKHAATLSKGEVGVLHGAMSYLLQDDDGQIIEPHSISAGLDYPGVGPEHSYLKDIGRAEYYSVTDDEALEAFKRLSRLEGIIPALETSHALAYLEQLCPTLPNGTRVVLNCSAEGIRMLKQLSSVCSFDGVFHVCAFKRLSRLEGIIPALETSHALAYLEQLCPTLPNGTRVVLNCSGRGDKDVETAIKRLQL
ncbi:tryptophan synthase beta chain 2 [Quercus suber]|uniref:tryptophan synthase n=1 Tax=Quercus suber TaxID=58331 RepID=A0AAW0L5L0_QUESU